MAFLAFVNTANAQLPNEKFGKPSSQEWEFSGWGDGFDADAVILCKTMKATYQISDQVANFNRNSSDVSSDNISDFGKRVVERKQVPILFPEGSRTRDGQVGKFFSAGFRQLTESTGLPVVVCALDGGWQLRDIRKMMTNLKCGCYRVKILRIYEPPKTKEDCNKILEESRVLMQQQIEYWRQLPTSKK